MEAYRTIGKRTFRVEVEISDCECVPCEELRSDGYQTYKVGVFLGIALIGFDCGQLGEK